MAESTNIHNNKTYDVAVVGAGVFGSWAANQLQKLGRRVMAQLTLAPVRAANRGLFGAGMATAKSTRDGHCARWKCGKSY